MVNVVDYFTAKKLRENGAIQGITTYKYAYDIHNKKIELIRQNVIVKSINIIYYDAPEVDAVCLN